MTDAPLDRYAFVSCHECQTASEVAPNPTGELFYACPACGANTSDHRVQATFYLDARDREAAELRKKQFKAAPV